MTVTHDESNPPPGDDPGPTRPAPDAPEAEPRTGRRASRRPRLRPDRRGSRPPGDGGGSRTAAEPRPTATERPTRWTRAPTTIDDEYEDEEEPFVVSPFDQPGRWYVVHTYAGYENKVKSNLHSRAVSMGMEDRIYEVVIPMEDVVEFKNGKKVVVQKKVFPGYLLCRCELDDDSWAVIRNTPGRDRLRRARHQADPAVAA